MQSFKKVSVIGLGYVGLPTAATIASRGVQVIGIDMRQDVVDRVNKGLTHILEPDLDIIVHSVVSTGMLKASTRPEPADAFIIAVPTPVLADKRPDMRAVEAALEAIAPVLAKGNLIVIESTSPVGTTQRAAEQLRKLRPDLDFPKPNGPGGDIYMAYCPERILPGNTMRELIDNARLVGGLDRASAERAHALYAIFAKGEIFRTKAAVAEMAKLAENAFRDVNIAFANELSLVCEQAGIDPWEVIQLSNRHPRVDILSPGPGVGGHCIPIDPWFIVSAFPEQARLMRTAREVNDGKQLHVSAKIREAANRFRSPRIALLGLSYKANVDDLRESPACAIAKDLIAADCGDIYLVEPNVRELPRIFADTPRVHWATAEEAIRQADVVAFLVAHDQFRDISFGALTEKVVIDAVGLLRPR
jgi:UDP-N-acetyl-D-mannosaminuronic acid dehydrogenase